MKTCFVVQGFGKKTDYTDGRVLDLDASYPIFNSTPLNLTKIMLRGLCKLLIIYKCN